MNIEIKENQEVFKIILDIDKDKNTYNIYICLNNKFQKKKKDDFIIISYDDFDVAYRECKLFVEKFLK